MIFLGGMGSILFWYSLWPLGVLDPLKSPFVFMELNDGGVKFLAPKPVGKAQHTVDDCEILDDLGWVKPYKQWNVYHLSTGDSDFATMV